MAAAASAVLIRQNAAGIWCCELCDKISVKDKTAAISHHPGCVGSVLVHVPHVPHVPRVRPCQPPVRRVVSPVTALPHFCPTF